MARIFNKKIRPAGLPPGSLVHAEDLESPKKIKISLIEYNENEFFEKSDISLEESTTHFENSLMTWIEVHGVSDPSTLALIGKHFKLHPLVLEDIYNTGQRSKLDIYQDQVFVIIRSLQYISDTKGLKDEQVSIVFGPNYLICFLEGDQNPFQQIKERIAQKKNRISKEGSDYLAYTLIDTIVDGYFAVLEKVDTDLDHLEEELLHEAKLNTIQAIQHSKREMILLRKAVWPIRDVVNRFLRLESPHVHPTTLVYMHDVYDHIIQTIDVIEGFRDVVAGMMDIYLSNINIRTNEIMKVLTIVSTIFVPLTFITSLYGMNFEYMPELHSRIAYPIALLVMLSIAGGMLLFFHRKKWI